jgi:hypothetical protein
MKTILMIGDSWGVPNYEGLPGSPPETHTEYRLRELGYKVYNCSMNARGNLAPIDLARRYLRGEIVILEPIHLNTDLRGYGIPKVIDEINPKIDYIIWFHTEFLRELYRKALPLHENIIEAAHTTYRTAAEFFSEHSEAKKVIIGGQAPLVMDILQQYIKPDFCIPDWRSEILKIKMPESHTLTKTFWIENSADSTESKLEMIEVNSKILEAMNRSPDFPDNCHPGGNAHKLLVEKIHKYISGPEVKKSQKSSL